MRRLLATLLLVACARVARADEATTTPANKSPVSPVTSPVSLVTSPVVSPATSVKTAPARSRASARAKWIAAGSIAAFHGLFWTWQNLAWNRKGDDPFHYEPPYDTFAPEVYAGGADKLGHFWGNYALTRGTTAVLVASGWPRLPSSLVSFGLTEAAYLVIELQDGIAPHGFGKKDLCANLVGGVVAVLFDNVPAVDRLFDIRLEYWPSKQYRRNVWRTGDLDGAQDYTGQSYLLAFHLGAISELADRDYGWWSRFVDLAAGFEAKHYVPVEDMQTAAPRQTLYAGLAVNMQGVLSHLFDDSKGRRFGRGLFEVYSLPHTTFRYVEASRSPLPPAP